MTTVRTATVRVPATSANLGPAFDCAGLALDLHDEVVVTAGGVVPGVQVLVDGEGASSVPTDETHLVVRALHAALDALHEPHPALVLRCTNRIPHGRGLGSSAAAVVAGLLAGRALVPDGPDRLSDAALLLIANAWEGHPDNAAACLYGGLTLAWTDPGPLPAVHAVRLEPRAELRATVLVPEAELATSTARGLLPGTVPHADAARTAGRAALLVAALTGVPGLLMPATEDWLHQGYRSSAMPGTATLVRALRAADRAAVVSGAGPSVLVLDEAPSAAVEPPTGWRSLPVAIARDGARVVSG